MNLRISNNIANINVNRSVDSTNNANNLSPELESKIIELKTDIKTNQTESKTSKASVLDKDTQSAVIGQMEEVFVDSFNDGVLDEYDPRAVMIAAQYTKIQFEDSSKRSSLLNSTLTELGINKLDNDTISEIALQAIELINGFEVDSVDTSKNMQTDLFDTVVNKNAKFKSQANNSKIDTDALRNVFNITEMNDSKKITKVYTISSYATSEWQKYDSLTVGEMLADFSGQESEHDGWWHNKGTAYNPNGGFSDHSFHNGDKSNDKELRELKQLMQSNNPELLNLTFDNGEAYVFGKTAGGKIILLSTIDNEQLGAARSQTHHDLAGYGWMDKDTAYNDSFKLLNDSQLQITGRSAGGAAEEFTGKTSMQIGKTKFENIDTMSIHRYSTPLILDLNGDGLNLGSHNDGITFDLTGDGVRDQTAWTKKQSSFDDAFLVLDKNNDGQINSGKELFGDQNGASNGFAELSKYDANNDGLINEKDDIYSKLELWADLNADGNVDENEMKSLAELGIKSINTNFSGKQGDKQDEYGNDLSMQGSFTRELNGQSISGTVTDVLFINKDASAQNLDDINAILTKKIKEYSETVKLQDKTIEINDLKSDNDEGGSFRQSSLVASQEIQKIGLSNELEFLEQQILLSESELNYLDSNEQESISTKKNQDSDQLTPEDEEKTNSPDTTKSLSNLTHKVTKDSTNQSKGTSNNGLDSLRNQISSLKIDKTNVSLKLANFQ